MEHNEPYSTLSATRGVPNLGLVFGTYIQTEVISDARQYAQIFDSKLGYPSFEQATSKNPISWSEFDGEFFVRVYKHDKIYARAVKEPEWAKILRERNRDTLSM